MKEANLRNYKISRVTRVQETTNKFRYPNGATWNPVEHFKNSSGIIVDTPQSAIFRVFGHSKNIIAEKNFYNSLLMHSCAEYDEYQCNYTNKEEFVGALFVYGQDIEIIESKALRDFFIEKAQEALSRNDPSKKAA